jgi:hypothetical protein
MISKQMRAGSDIVDSLSHFPMISAQLWSQTLILTCPSLYPYPVLVLVPGPGPIPVLVPGPGPVPVSVQVYMFFL